MSQSFGIWTALSTFLKHFSALWAHSTHVMSAHVQPAPCQVPVDDPVWCVPSLCQAAVKSALVNKCLEHAFPKCSGASLDPALFLESIWKMPGCKKDKHNPRRIFLPQDEMCSLWSVPDLFPLTLHTVSLGDLTPMASNDIFLSMTIYNLDIQPWFSPKTQPYIFSRLWALPISSLWDLAMEDWHSMSSAVTSEVCFFYHDPEKEMFSSANKDTYTRVHTPLRLKFYCIK